MYVCMQSLILKCTLFLIERVLCLLTVNTNPFHGHSVPSMNTRTWGGGTLYRVSVYGCSMDVPVTVPSMDTRTRGGVTLYRVSVHGCFMDVQLMCHPWILGCGVEVHVSTV